MREGKLAYAAADWNLRRRGWKHGVHWSITNEIPRDGGTAVAHNRFVQGGRDVGEPFVAERIVWRGIVVNASVR